MPKKKTHEQFLEDLLKVNTNIIVLGKYENARTPVLCKCKKCDHEWPGIPNNLLRGEECMNCAGHLKKTTKKFISEMAEVNPDIEILGEYEDIHTKIVCRCKVCNHKWKAEPASLLEGHGCKPCGRKKAAKKRTKSNETFLEELAEKNPGVVALEPYVKAKNPIHCRCSCGNEDWYPTPSDLLKGSLCSICAKEKRSQKLLKPEITFRKEIEERNPYIEIVGTYKGMDERVACRCKRCEHEWEPFASFVYRGGGCPACNKRFMTSFPEQAIYYYIKPIYEDAINSYKKGFGRSSK